VVGPGSDLSPAERASTGLEKPEKFRVLEGDELKTYLDKMETRK
jgi:hypothetical protein